MNTTSPYAGIGLSPEAEARIARASLIAARAHRIVDRVLPILPAVSGFYEAEQFIAASRRHGERENLYWRTLARLRAKVEGGKPSLALPKDCPAVSGGVMGDVAREMEAV